MNDLATALGYDDQLFMKMMQKAGLIRVSVLRMCDDWLACWHAAMATTNKTVLLLAAAVLPSSRPFLPSLYSVGVPACLPVCLSACHVRWLAVCLSICLRALLCD